jgi:hypothetical protein
MIMVLQMLKLSSCNNSAYHGYEQVQYLACLVMSKGHILHAHYMLSYGNMRDVLNSILLEGYINTIIMLMYLSTSLKFLYVMVLSSQKMARSSSSCFLSLQLFIFKNYTLPIMIHT